MKWEIIDAEMVYSKEEGYLGKVRFSLEGQRSRYEITLQSKKGNEWSYSLNFTEESGIEAEIEAAEERLEEDDELFDALVEAAKAKLQ
ncbi:hypothetical protein FE783_19520 [Paenibacillus mesophilus]|uniref:hypothetical protein n=1 Tax=Paenibacillus mesophilus TaxID=2582849 RepID=UPI00110EC9E1|nr:hypothetical protein [Paenibacillus mesophilus]TMV48142.1 hypothetical protein FE783_19520 [Paenibacillus mesophilus]